MEIKHLTSFLAVAELGSMTAAAHRLSITQSAVSQHIRSLECEIGAKLFIRHPQSVKLTELGEVFLPGAKDIVQKEKECFEEISSRNGHICGTINIGAGCFIEPLIGVDLCDFMLRYPNVHVHMHYDYAHILNDKLRHHELDIAFSMNDAYEHEGIISTPCYSFQLYAIMSRSHQYSKKKIITFDELAHCNILMPDSGRREISTIQKFIDGDLRRILAASRCECNNANSLLNGLERLNAVTFLPREYVIHRSNLVAIPIKGFERRVNSNYHVMRDAPMKASVKALLQIIEENKKKNIDNIYR